MQYTLWSKGRLVGHSDLGFVESTPGVRFGWFHPTETGVPIVEVITAPSRLFLLARQRGDRSSLDAEIEIAGASVDALESEVEELQFIKAFRNLIRIMNVLKSFSQFDWGVSEVMEERAQSPTVTGRCANCPPAPSAFCNGDIQ